MQNPDGLSIRAGAVLLSLLLHGLLLATFGGTQSASSLQQEVLPVTRLTFLPTEPEPVVVPEVIPNPVPEKPKPEPVRKPDPQVVKKPKPESEPVRKPVREVIPEPVFVPQPAVAAVAPPVAKPAAKPQVDTGLIERETGRYLARVMSHIEKHKWYPRLARRRGIEGVVTVSFQLHHDGTPERLIIENGPSMLMAAARKTLERALPLPKPPAGIDCPIACKFRLAFHLKRS